MKQLKIGLGTVSKVYLGCTVIPPNYMANVILNPTVCVAFSIQHRLP